MLIVEKLIIMFECIQAKKAVEPVEVIDLEDDDEEEKREEEAPMQQSDQRRRSLRAGGSRGGTASLREVSRLR